MAGHFPDDGIPVLTEMVDAAWLPAINAASLEPEDHDDVGGPPSLAMFPELEADAGYPLPPESPPPGLVASIIETSPAMPLAAPTAPQPPDPPLAMSLDMLGVLSVGAPELPPEASNAAHYEAPPEDAPETLDAPAVDSHSLSQALREPFSQFAPQRETSYAERYAARYAALHQLPPVVIVTPAVEPAHTSSAPADHVAQSVPAASEIAAPESLSEIETRIFESIAAQLDRLLDQRLEAIVPGVVEAALYGIQAGMAASVKQALREAVEQAVRNEFERKREP